MCLFSGDVLRDKIVVAEDVCREIMDSLHIKQNFSVIRMMSAICCPAMLVTGEYNF